MALAFDVRVGDLNWYVGIARVVCVIGLFPGRADAFVTMRPGSSSSML